jgi:hypothetical protein
MSRFLVCTTLTTYAMQDPQIWGSWLAHAEQMQRDGGEFFAAIETDARGLAPFEPLIARLHNLTGRIWEFSLDCGREQVTQKNRQTHIATGQNLCAEYAMQHGYRYMLLLGADTEPPPDVLPRLHEVDRPVVGAECPVYALTGPREPDRYPLQKKLATGCLLISHEVFSQLRWMPSPGLSDDWNYQRQCEYFLGIDQVVRTDVICKHYPEAIGVVEDRYDTEVYRA